MRDPERGTRAWTQPVVITLPAEIDISNADRIGDELCAALGLSTRKMVVPRGAMRFAAYAGRGGSGADFHALKARRASADDGHLGAGDVAHGVS